MQQVHSWRPFLRSNFMRSLRKKYHKRNSTEWIPRVTKENHGHRRLKASFRVLPPPLTAHVKWFILLVPPHTKTALTAQLWEHPSRNTQHRAWHQDSSHSMAVNPPDTHGLFRGSTYGFIRQQGVTLMQPKTLLQGEHKTTPVQQWSTRVHLQPQKLKKKDETFLFFCRSDIYSQKWTLGTVINSVKIL